MGLVNVSFMLLLIACSQKKTTNDIQINQQSRVITYKIVENETDDLCLKWEKPEMEEFFDIFPLLDSVSSIEWNGCFDNWSCGYEGEVVIEGENFSFSLDAGGWVILYNKESQLYYVCRKKACKKYFPSTSACDSLGNYLH